MSIPSEQAVQQLLDWVRDGNPISDDEDNDLEELNGHDNLNDDTFNDSTYDDDIDMTIDATVEDETSLADNEGDVIPSTGYLVESSSRCLVSDDEESLDAEVDVIPLTKVVESSSSHSMSDDEVGSSHVHAASSGSESSSDDEELPPKPKRRRRTNLQPKKLLTAKRNVRSIDTALDVNNYEQMKYPKTVSGSKKHETLIGYLGPASDPKTKKISWVSSPPSASGRQRQADIVNGPVGTLRYSDNLTDIRSIFDSMIDDVIMERIVTKTNMKLKSNLELFKSDDSINLDDKRYNYMKQETDKIEMHALIGLMYWRGLENKNSASKNSLFKDQKSHALFSATMSRNRFIYLSTIISFDDPEERKLNWPLDRFAAIREIFEIMMKNCQKYVIPSEFLCIDETLYPMRNQVSIKQFNKNKPAKYGLLFRSLNDSRFPYTYNSIVYAGKPESGTGPYYLSGINEYVQKLVDGVSSVLPLQGRNITTDRLYTSISMANWLLNKKGMTMVGTIQANRIGVPAQLKDPINRKDFSNTIHYEKEAKDLVICSYTVNPKSSTKKNCLLLSSMRPLMGITSDDKKQKPALFKLYDFTKGGTDVVDQRIGYYTTKAKSHRWSITAFYYMLDTARVNAQTIYSLKKKKDPRKSNSFDIGFELVMSLVLPHMARRPYRGLRSSIIKKIELFIPKEPSETHPGEQLRNKKGIKRKLCETCLKSIQGEGYTEKKAALPRNFCQCQRCGEGCCPKHQVHVCQNCVAYV